MKFNRRCLLAAASCLALAAAGVHAAPFPSKPIRIIVGFAPGGATDAVARILAQDMAQTLGQPVVVENRPGATGNLATDQVRRAEPDGYTLLLTSQSHITNPLLLKVADYDAVKDFTPITRAAVLPMLVVTGGTSPWNSVKDLVAAARTAPGSVSYAGAGIGGAGHLNGELLAQATGSQMVHVPFKGSAPGLAEVMAGRVGFQFTPIPGVNQQVAARNLKVLAVSAPKRLADWPDVPTLDEQGLPGFADASPWLGLVAPKGVPQPVLAALNAAAVKSLRDPRTQARMTTLGAIPGSTSPAEFTAFLEADVKRWERIIKSSGLRPE